MPNVLIYKARALKPQTRAAVEAELGRALKDDEDVSIMAFGTHDAPAIEARSRSSQPNSTPAPFTKFVKGLRHPKLSERIED